MNVQSIGLARLQCAQFNGELGLIVNDIFPKNNLQQERNQES